MRYSEEEQRSGRPRGPRNTLPYFRPRVLRKEREFAFYGDVDFIPTEAYSVEDGLRAVADAQRCVAAARMVIEANGR